MCLSPDGSLIASSSWDSTFEPGTLSEEPKPPSLKDIPSWALAVISHQILLSSIRIVIGIRGTGKGAFVAPS